ncbi:hypothetical protein WA588_003527 [Blastocystis sp. NMH]
MLDLIHEKKAELLNKIQRINLLNQQIAELDAPAERDVSALRRKIDSCFRQIWSLERSKEEAEVAIEEAQKVQQTLQEQRTALNEKKKVAIFEFESKHLQTLKEIEDEIRGMTA